MLRLEIFMLLICVFEVQTCYVLKFYTRLKYIDMVHHVCRSETVYAIHLNFNAKCCKN